MPAPSYVSFGNENDGAGDVTYGLPVNEGSGGSAIQLDDWLLLPITTSGSIPDLPNDAWEYLATIGVGTEPTGLRLTLMGLRLPYAGEPGPTVEDPGDHQAGHTIAIRPVTPGMMWNIQAVEVNSTEVAGTAMNPPTLPNAGPDAIVLIIVGGKRDDTQWQGSIAWTNPDLTNIAEFDLFIGFNTVNGTGSQFSGVSGKRQSAGAVGPTVSAWNAVMSSQVAMTIALTESIVPEDNSRSVHRRAGASLVQFINSSGDPPTNGLRYQLYTKQVLGLEQLFGKTTDGTVYQITPPAALELASSIEDDFIDDGASSFSLLGAATNLFSAHLGADRPGISTATVTAPVVDVHHITRGDTSILFGGGPVRFAVSHQIVVLSDGVNNVVVREGYGDNDATDHDNGVYVEYNLDAFGDHNYRLCGAAGGARTKLDTGVAAVAGSMRKIEIFINEAGDAAWVAFDGVLAPIVLITNIPVASAHAFHIVLQTTKQLGVLPRSVIRDYYTHRHLISSAR